MNDDTARPTSQPDLIDATALRTEIVTAIDQLNDVSPDGRTAAWAWCVCALEWMLATIDRAPRTAANVAPSPSQCAAHVEAGGIVEEVDLDTGEWLAASVPASVWRRLSNPDRPRHGIRLRPATSGGETS